MQHRYTCAKGRKGFDHVHTYKIRPSGHIEVDNSFGIDKGLPHVPRLGLRMTLAGDLENLAWFGRGPHESYRDRKAGAPIGCYRGKVREQFYRYVVPQENGNKEDVRWLSLVDEKGVGLHVDGAPTLGFSAHHITPEDLTRAYHITEVHEREEITLLLDLVQRGLGTLSCGPDTLEQYLIQPGEYRFRYSFCIGSVQ